jgi:spore coat polysaccharide biosynthesis protein SpsF
MKIVAVVQARVQSTRLPAKVLLDLGGVTALERCLSRARRIPHVDRVVVATSDAPADELIARVAARLGYAVVRGSESDVLSRTIDAARAHEADAVVRLTSDCPLLDPDESSRVVEAFLERKPDYASNVIDRRLPRGLDTEIVSREALERAHRDATATDEREHVTLHIVRRAGNFRLLSVTGAAPGDQSRHRWTLDTLDDYRFLHALVDLLGDRAGAAPLAEVLEVLSKNPHLSALNAHVEQKKV